jgi:nicotinate-nucleotide pyrophosphorylase (carboxylating)
VAGIEESLALCDIAGVTGSSGTADGAEIEAGVEALRVEGNARGVLGVERTLLNLLGHMSGIATLTRMAVRAVAANHRGTIAPCPPRVAATRKTLPGLRYFEKKAVIIGGGSPHRFDLSEAVLIKDNHLALATDVAAAVKRARERAGDVQIEVEVETLEQAVSAAIAGADALLLDNMSAPLVEQVVKTLQKRGLRADRVIEASGGITITTVSDYADTGVDLISMGVLTASAPRLDFSLHLTA